MDSLNKDQDSPVPSGNVEIEAEDVKGSTHVDVVPTLDSEQVADEALLEQMWIIPTSDTPRKTTTRKEIWSYYAFYFGNNGVQPYLYGPTQFQNLIYAAGWDPAYPAGTVACSTGGCVANFGGIKPVASIVLDMSGIAFAIQAVLLVTFGSLADYGNWRRYILLAFTFIMYGVGFAWLGVETPDKWGASAVLYVMGFLGYQVVIVYFVAAHVGLARDTPEMQESEQAVIERRKTPKEHFDLDVQTRNHIADLSYAWTSAGGTLVCVIACGIFAAMKTSESVAANNAAYSVMCAFCTGLWVVCGVPWQLWEQSRPGQKLPPGQTYLTIGFVNLWQSLKTVLTLKQTLLYLAAYFILGDSANTTYTIISIAQNTVISYDIVTYNYLSIIGYGGEGIGILLLLLAQKRWKLSTKACMTFNAGSFIVANIWGFAGIWTDVIGYKHAWEFWLFAVYNGLVMSSWYQISLNMIAEVTPVTKMFLFYSLFGILGKTSAFIGPFVTSAIITRADGNSNMSFAFLLPMSVLGFILMCLINVKKSHIECKAFLEKEAVALYEKNLRREDRIHA
ncbi:autophagy-related protein 22-like protein [Naematelia encephala]|uniref:Autophagy-related protein n=1 Tax=Naematelia encephala TaxID=71784 RepID=A0A1Y2B6N1_9TREE|nr:autophagy-related protein 22-like protein [Naematelia encephala]